MRAPILIQWLTLDVVLQDAFVEENGLLVLSSLLSTSKASALLQAVLRCLGAFVHQGCVPDAHGAQNDVGRAAGNVMLLERSRAIPAAMRLSSAHESPDFSGAEAKGVSLAALNLLLKVSAVPEMRTTLRCAKSPTLLASTLSFFVTAVPALMHGSAPLRHENICDMRPALLYDIRCIPAPARPQSLDQTDRWI